MAGRDLDRGRILLPDPITVTLTRPASLSAGPEESVSVSYVQRQAIDHTEVDSPLGGVLSGERRRYHLWALECEGLVPGMDYEIADPDGTNWHVERVEILAHGRRYRLHCHRIQE
jgi:hypothetical protein